MQTKWIFNNLKVVGKSNEVQMFSEKATGIYLRRHDNDRSSKLCFDCLLPLKPDASPMDEIAEWGCKLGAFDAVFVESKPTESKAMIEYSFKTPFTPPVELFNQVSKVFKTLEFSLNFRPESNEFAGRIEWSGGCKVVDETRTTPTPLA